MDNNYISHVLAGFSTASSCAVYSLLEKGATGFYKILSHVLPSSVSFSESESQLREEGKAEDLNLLCALLPGSVPGWVPSVGLGPSSPAWPHERLADTRPSLAFGEHEDWRR